MMMRSEAHSIPAHPVTAADGIGASRPRQKTVLIVDDQADERAIQHTLLQHLGYRVMEAADGEEALEVALEHAPDLVLLDIAMPRMDGLAVCRELKRDPRTADTAVLFLTASLAGETEDEVLATGASGVLIKPVDPNDVAEEVRKLIGPGNGEPETGNREQGTGDRGDEG